MKYRPWSWSWSEVLGLEVSLEVSLEVGLDNVMGLGTEKTPFEVNAVDLLL